MDHLTSEQSSIPASVLAPTPPARRAPALERRGRAWLLWSFLLCPCHLPLTLAVLASVLTGTSLGVALRDHTWVAGVLISVAWIGGTGYGLRLIRQSALAQGACPVPVRTNDRH